MTFLPKTAVVNGEGTPRLILVLPDPLYANSQTTFPDDETIQLATGAAKSISTSTGEEGGPTGSDRIHVVGHGLVPGEWISISGHTGSTPSINGDHYVTNVFDANTIRIDVGISVGGTGGTLHSEPGLAFTAAGVRINQRIRSAIAAVGDVPEQPVYAKITSVDTSGNKIGIDAWVGGSPTAGQPVYVDGWIADLPRCQEFTETFDPDVLVHNLYRGRKKTKFYGWRYEAVLDYKKYIEGDTLVDMGHHLDAHDEDRLILVPRRDEPAFQYNVYFAAPIELSMFGRARGHRKVALTLRAKENVASFPIESGYGFGYALNYGNEL